MYILKFPLVATSVFLLLSSLPTVAQNLYWDTNSGTGGIQGGNGTWNNSSYWNPNSDGSGTAQNWTASDNANFTATDVASTINLEGNTYSVTNLVKGGTQSLTLTSGTLSVGGNITVTTGVTTLGNVTLSGASDTQTIRFGNVHNTTLFGTLNIGANNFYLDSDATGNNASAFRATLIGSGDMIINKPAAAGSNLISINANNGANWSGNLVINGTGLTQFATGSFLTKNNTLDFQANGLVSLRSSTTIAGLSGSTGQVRAEVPSAVITIDTSVNGDASFGGNLIIYPNRPDLTLGVTKTGAGSQGFSGTNTMTGNILITGGTLQIGNGGTTGSFTGINAITNNSNLTINRSNDFTQSTDLNGKAITGTGSVTQAGSGALILDAANTFSGGTTLNTGTLVIANTSGASSGSITQTDGGSLLKFDTTGTVANDMSVYNVASNQTVTLTGNTTTNNATYDVASGTTLTVNGKISGSGSLTMNGVGTLALEAANDYSGGTSVTSGTLQVGTGGTTGSVVGTISAMGGGVLEFNRSDATTISNTLAGNGTFRQIGGDTLTLDGTNTTNGTIAVTNGTIFFSGADALPANSSLSAATNGTLSVADGTIRSSTLAGGLTMDGGSFVFDLNSTASDLVAFNGAASLSGTNVVKLNLTNATSSTWTLMTAASGMDGGTWSLDTDSFDTSGLTWTLTSNATTLTLSSSAATNLFYWTGNNSASWGVADNWSSDSAGNSPRATAPSAADDLIFTADTASNLSTTLGADITVNTISITAPGVSIAAGNTLTANATSSLAFDISADSGTTTLAASLAGANAGLAKSGNGSLTLSGSNTYGGATTISGGTLMISGGAAIADTGTVVLADTAGVQFTISTSETIASLQGGGATGGNVTIASGQTLTVAETGSNTFSGVIDGAGGLVHSGAGTMVLDGENTYTGATTIAAGTLQIGSGNATGSIDFSSGITNNGTLVFNRSDSLVETRTITGSGATIIASGTLQLGNGGTSGALASQGAITNNGVLAFNRSDVITVSQTISGSGGLTKLGGGTLVLSGNNSYTGTRTLAAGTLQLDHANAIGTTGNVTFTGGTLAYTANNTADISSRIVSSSSAITIDTNGQDVTYATGIAASNSGGLVKSGSGTLVLVGDNAYTGTATINAGTLQIGNGGATGSLGNYSMTNNGTFVFNTSANLDVGDLVVSGSGDIVKQGSGQIRIGNAASSSNWTGDFVIANASQYVQVLGDTFFTKDNLLKFDANGVLSTRAPAVTVGGLSGTSGTVNLEGNIGTRSLLIDTSVLGDASFGGNISNSSGSNLNVTKNGTGTQTLFGTNIVTGTLLIAGGTLQIGNGGTTGSFTGINAITNDSNLTINRSNDFSQSTDLNGKAITGTGSLTQAGSGVLILDAANTFTGATVVNNGTLEANAAGSLATTSNITVTGGSLLVTADNAIGDSVEIELAGGTLEFSGNVTDTIGALTLSANSVIDLGTGSVVAIFADLFMGNYTLAVHNWTGTTLWDGGTGNNTDQIYFNRALASGELERISFYSDFGSSFIGTGFQLGLGSGFQYEVIPVPEAETWVAAAVLLAGVGVAWMRGRRRQKLKMDGQDQQDGACS